MSEPGSSGPKQSTPNVTSAAATTELPAPSTAVHEQSAVAAQPVSTPSIHPTLPPPSAPDQQIATTDAPQASVPSVAAPKQQVAEASPVAHAASAELQQMTATPREQIDKSVTAGAGPASVAAAIPQSKPDVKSLTGEKASAFSHSSGHPSLTGGIDTPADVARDASLVSTPQIALAGASPKQQSDERLPTASVASAAPTSQSPLSQSVNPGASGAAKVAIDAAPARSDAQPTTQPAFAAARTSDRVAALLAGPSSSEAAPAPSADPAAAGPQVAVATPHASPASASDKPLVADGSPSADPTTRPIAANSVASLVGDKSGQIGVADGAIGVAPALPDSTLGTGGAFNGPRHSAGTPAGASESVAVALPDSSPAGVDPILPHAGAKQTQSIAGAQPIEGAAPAAGSPLASSRLISASGPPGTAPASIGLPAATVSAPPGDSIAVAPILPRPSAMPNTTGAGTSQCNARGGD